MQRRRLQPASSLLTADSSSKCWLGRAIELVPYLGRDRATVTLKRGQAQRRLSVIALRRLQCYGVMHNLRLQQESEIHVCRVDAYDVSHEQSMSVTAGTDDVPNAASAFSCYAGHVVCIAYVAQIWSLSHSTHLKLYHFR